jgi:hypothetical protein
VQMSLDQELGVSLGAEDVGDGDRKERAKSLASPMHHISWRERELNAGGGGTTHSISLNKTQDNKTHVDHPPTA